MNKQTLISSVLVLAALSGCATSPPPKEPPPPVPVAVADSRQVGMAPYITNGIIVAPGTNWYLGQTDGISAYAALGGIRYVQMELPPEPVEEKSTGAAQFDDGATSREVCDASLDCESGMAKVGAFTLQYETNAHQPTDAHLNEIAKQAIQVMADHGPAERLLFSIAGFTDSRGSDAYNQALAERRATAAAQALRSLVPKAVIHAKGMGKYPQAATNDTEQGRSANRRVEVRVFEEKQ